MLDLWELRHPVYDKKQNEAIRVFIWSFILDRWLHKNKFKLFYNQIDKQTEKHFRVLDEKYFQKYNPKIFKDISFTLDNWIVKEFYDNKTFILNLPIVENKTSKNMTEIFQHSFLRHLVKARKIDDIAYHVFYSVIRILWIYYDAENWYVWFWDKPVKKYIFTNWKKVKLDVFDLSLEDVLRAEVDQWFINKEIGDPHRKYAYTHLLRQHAKFRLTTWAKKLLINRTKYNIVAASRWNWKSYLAAYIAIRWLLDPRPWFGWRNYREIKFFVPNTENVWGQIFEYINSLIWDIKWFKLKSWKKAFEMWKNYIKCNITWNNLKLVSLYNFGRWWWELWAWTWEWLACDLAIIDEAARIPNDFWISFHQRAAFETSDFFLISTINEETPADHWFYEMLIEWELSNKDTMCSLRVTIDDNEIMRFGRTDEEWYQIIEMIKSELRKKWEKEFYSKWYCMILDESNVFNLSTAIAPSNPNKYSQDDIRILWFDLWKLDDTAWLTLVNLTHMEVEESIKVNNITYWQQIEYAWDYKKKFPHIYVIWDRSWVWEAVSEQDTGWVVDVWIKSTWQWELNYNKKHKFYTCSKWLIINTLATILNNNIIKIPYHNSDLVDQLTNFVKMKSGRWETLLYKGKGKKKDDLVLSLAYAITYMALILWLKTKEDIEHYVNEIWNTYTYFYNDRDDGYSNSYHWSLY